MVRLPLLATGFAVASFAAAYDKSRPVFDILFNDECMKCLDPIQKDCLGAGDGGSKAYAECFCPIPGKHWEATKKCIDNPQCGAAYVYAGFASECFVDRREEAFQEICTEEARKDPYLKELGSYGCGDKTVPPKAATQTAKPTAATTSTKPPTQTPTTRPPVFGNPIGAQCLQCLDPIQYSCDDAEDPLDRKYTDCFCPVPGRVWSEVKKCIQDPNSNCGPGNGEMKYVLASFAAECFSSRRPEAIHDICNDEAQKDPLVKELALYGCGGENVTSTSGSQPTSTKVTVTSIKSSASNTIVTSSKTAPTSASAPINSTTLTRFQNTTVPCSTSTRTTSTPAEISTVPCQGCKNPPGHTDVATVPCQTCHNSPSQTAPGSDSTSIATPPVVVGGASSLMGGSALAAAVIAGVAMVGL